VTLHRLASIVIGVPEPDPVTEFYAAFGLTVEDRGVLASLEGGRQLFVEKAATRRLLEMVVCTDDEHDLARVGDALSVAGYEATEAKDALSMIEPNTGVRLVLRIAPRVGPVQIPSAPPSSLGRLPRRDRAAAVLRHDRVKPRKLGHVVITTTDLAATSEFFTNVVGFKVSDYIGNVGVFLRCSSDHHNLLILSAAVVYLHHTAWQVDDVDEIGQAAFSLLEGHPERHVWGLGRHHAGSNLFWYLRDPAGNYVEYYADLDEISDDVAWIPQTYEGRLALYSWGPPPPADFLQPEDVSELAASLLAPGVQHH
jgi:catechol 2,3-dioxygenase-like lactoylglutathione lyase family enzyme